MMLKPCPECGSPMTDIFDPAENMPYWKCTWCNCEREYLTRKIIRHGDDAAVAECKRYANPGALANAYRQGFLNGRKSIRKENKP